MDTGRRLEYLQAIGVDLWVRRVAPPQAAAVAEEGAVDAQTVPVEPSLQISAVGVPALELEPQAAEDAPLANPVAPAETPRILSQPSRHSGSPSISVPIPRAKPGSRTVVTTRTTVTNPLTADEASQWQALTAEVLSCTKCQLHSTRTQGVFGVGNRRADWLIIGEAPGAEEDRRGEPFVGRAGQLLNAMLKAIGLDREQVFIANVLKSRPPNNRDPKPEEVAACLPYLMRQIALLQPRLMLAVGRIAAQNLLQTDMALGRLRSQVHTFGELNTPLIVTYHPAYLLRSPADKRKAWEDLKFARSTFQRLAAQES
jgi:uracil-DNA glycosylase